ncbi:MAG: hypothetical protein WDW38_002131 [Sanguina aurantia]
MMSLQSVSRSALTASKVPASSPACATPLRASPPRFRTQQRMQAFAKPPPGVTLPPFQPQTPPTKYGFVDNAETMNSRACMMGFFALLLLEAVTGTGLLDLMGFTTGSGLGFEL